MAIKIAFANFEENCGKTLSAISVSSILADQGYKVLFIDCDMNGRASERLGADMEENSTIDDIFFSGYDAAQCIQSVDYVDIIPCSEEFYDFESKLTMNRDKYLYIKNAIEEVEDDYDYVIFDTPAKDSVLFGNAMMASEYIVVPFSSEVNNFFYKTVEEYQDCNSNLFILGAFGIKPYNHDRSYEEGKNEISTKIPVFAAELNMDVENTKYLEEDRRILYGKTGYDIERVYNLLTEEILDNIPESR